MFNGWWVFPAVIGRTCQGYNLYEVFASLVGAAGFVLGLLAWTKFRGSSFGRILAIIPLFILILAVYHPILILFPAYTEIALLMETLGFSLLVVFVGLMIRIHRRMSSASRGIDP